MGKHNKAVTITIIKAHVGHRARCEGCTYVSIQHSDKRRAITAGEDHAKKKHPGATVLFRGDVG